MTAAEYAALPDFPMPKGPQDFLFCPNPACNPNVEAELVLIQDTVCVSAAVGVVGVNRIRLAVDDNSEYEGYDHDRIRCTSCGSEWAYREVGGRTYAGSHNELKDQVARSLEGRGPDICHCPEDQLAKVGITFVSLIDGGSAGYEAPTIRAWLTADGRVAKVCPLCDEDLFRKHSQVIAAGMRASAALVAPDNASPTGRFG